MNTQVDPYVLSALLRLAVAGEGQVSVISDWVTLLKEAKFHHVEPLVWRAVTKARLSAPEEISSTLQLAYHKAAFRDAQQDAVAMRLRAALCERKIPYVLLWGAVLKRDYPEPCLRTMADLDYLVRAEDCPKTRLAAETIGDRLSIRTGGITHFCSRRR